MTPPASSGVPVVRNPLDHRELHPDDGCWPTYDWEPGVWFPLSARAELREQIAETIFEADNNIDDFESGELADAILALLGLEDAS